MLEDKVTYNRIYARVDIDAIRANVCTLKKGVKSDMKALAVIKADGYGHGSVMLAKELDDLTDYYGVATIDEAVELRQAGIVKPILIIGYTAPENFSDLLQYDITQAIYRLEDCECLSELAVKAGKKAKVHIKVDTGMSRIGFAVSEEGLASAKKVKDYPGLEVEGIFTHFAKADEIDKQYAFGQKEKFLYFIDELEKAGYHFAIKHCDNSAATMEMDDPEFDMVRMGISIYGLYPSEEVSHEIPLIPAMSMIAHVAHVKTLPAGVGVGYGWTYTTTKETKVATVTVGYADGYPRAQSNIGRVIIRDSYAPIIGRVCMDQIMVDVTDLPEVAVGDEVVLFGKSDSLEISVEEVAEPAASFNYELVCNVARRVPRVYTKNGIPYAQVNYLR